MATALILSVGCGDDSSSDAIEDASTVKADAATKSDASTKADAGSSTSAGDPVAGKAVAKDKVCASCHGTDYSGVGFYPNVTPDVATGIGSWTDDQIVAAINVGTKNDGTKLCNTMLEYKLDATDTANILAYLKSLPAVTNKITSKCTAPANK